MKTFTLKGEERKVLGKKDAKKLRSNENVPAVMYGAGEPIHFSIPFSELRALIYTPDVFLINIELEGKTYQAIMQDVQWHAVEEQILHIDFLRVEENKPIKVNLPIKIAGVAKGIKSGGKLKSNLRHLKVKALAKDLPESIEINVTKLGVGQSIKVADMTMENVEFLDTKSNVIVSVTMTRAARSAGSPVVEEAEEAEE
jgi:large subunit ribosomal protein L25